MSFFVTSAGPGKGADLGGLAGADKHCQQLAQAVGAGGKTWHAYLSTQGAGAVNARDRIGKGPWTNAKGVVIAKSVDELHGANNLTKQTALSEKGEVINGRGDKPNRHDILTGSQADGRAFPADKDMTCKNYTSSTQGAVMLGHADRIGLTDDAVAKSWNSSHPSRGAEGGCSQADLRSTGVASDDPAGRLTASIGVATCASDASGYDNLFEVADKRLYAAKAAGRNRVIGARPVNGDAPVRLVHQAG